MHRELRAQTLWYTIYFLRIYYAKYRQIREKMPCAGSLHHRIRGRQYIARDVLAHGKLEKVLRRRVDRCRRASKLSVDQVAEHAQRRRLGLYLVNFMKSEGERVENQRLILRDLLTHIGKENLV